MDKEKIKLCTQLRLRESDYKVFKKISYLEERSMASIVNEIFQKDFVKRKKKHGFNA